MIPVFRNALLIGIIASFVGLLISSSIFWGMLTGAIVALANLVSVNFLVKRIATPEKIKKLKLKIFGVLISKLLLIGLIFYFFLVIAKISPLGLFAGLTVVLAAFMIQAGFFHPNRLSDEPLQR